jgi:hypothetical protein
VGADVGVGSVSSFFTVVPFLVVVVLVLTVGSAVVRLVRAATGRTGGARAGRTTVALQAPDPGWQRTARDDSLVDRFRGGPFDEDGFERGAVDVLRTTIDGFPVTAFTYVWHTKEYETVHGTGSGTRSRRHSYVARHDLPIIAVETSGTGVLPRLDLKPEGFLGPVLNRLSGAEIEIGDAELDRAWSIRGVDGERARRFFGPDVRGLLMASSLRGERILLSGEYAFVWSSTVVGAVSRDLVALVRSGLTAIDGVPPSAPRTAAGNPAVSDAPSAPVWGTPERR